MSRFVKIGLTGGIASGKSRVADLLKKAGIPVIDMDAISKSLLDHDPELQKKVISAFGPHILTQGKIDRGKVRELVFADPKKKQLLESWIHPIVRSEFERLASTEHQKGHQLVVCEAALLIEGGYRKSLDQLVVVLAPEALRIKRLMDRDRISQELAQQMIGTQCSDEQRKELANHLILNDQDERTLVQQVENLLKIWKKDGLI